MERPLLFKRCPAVEREIEWVELGEYPTPVEKLAGLGAAEGIDDLYIKRDDLSSPCYGGNKVRKLEFLLADARARGAGSVLTFGAAGSNHVVATVIHGERLGLKAVAVMFPQPNAAYVRKNLLLNHEHGALFSLADSYAGLPAAFIRGCRMGVAGGNLPYVIPPGGSNLLGSLGYVDAALELKSQVDEGLLPEPEFIFVTYGSGSTAAGLLAGVMLAGLSSTVVPVRVVERFACNRWILSYHVKAALKFLENHCAGASPGSIHPRDIIFIDEFAGNRYARFTVEGMDAVRKARELDGVRLDGTYTGKTMAGALHFIRKHRLSDRPCLFWNTFSSVDLYPAVSRVDYLELPEDLHRYFTEPLQEEMLGHEIVF
jgi:D-cysteine desulfhydrase